MPSDEQSSRRAFLTAAGSAAASVALAGCIGGDGGGATTTATTTEAETGTETPADTETGMPAATGTGTETGMAGGETATGTQAGTDAETDAGTEAGTDAGNETGTETGGTQPAPGEFPVTITQGQMPSTLDPHDHRAIPVDIVMLQAYEGLLRRTQEGQIEASLATEWTRQEPGRVRFRIREGPTFQKTGNELTPEDVVYSINRIVDESVGFTSPQAGQLAGVTGAEVVDGERAVDVLSDGLNPIVFAEFSIYCDIMERAWVEDHEKSYIAQHMNGTGPFELSDYQRNVRVVFERYDDYWREPAAVSQLTFNSATEPSVRVNQLIAGETDLAVNVPPQSVSRVDEGDDTRISATGSTRVLFSAMRSDVEPFSTPAFRQAMNYAIDLESIVSNVLQGFGAQTGQPTLEPFFGYASDVSPYAFDQQQAEQLVEESGHAGASITLDTPVGRYLKDVEIAQAIAGYIDQLSNVSCEVRQRDFNTLAGEVTDGEIETSPEFYLLGWGNATFDASQTINPLLTSDGTLTSYRNDELDSLIEEANGTAEREQRGQLLQQANTLCHDQAPWIFLNRQYSVYGIADRLQWEPRVDERIDAYNIQPAN